MRTRADLRGVYAITLDRLDTQRLIDDCEPILAAGCRLLQYRNKTADAALRGRQAEVLRELTQRHGAKLIVNDDIELALACDADGVHLGVDDGDIESARSRLGPGKILGASCYRDLGRARMAAAGGADYLAFGSFFASPTKPRARRADLGLLAEAKRRYGLPVCAIGGIDADNAAALVAAGADMLAVITALFEAPDPAAATRNLIKTFEENHP